MLTVSPLPTEPAEPTSPTRVPRKRRKRMLQILFLLLGIYLGASVGVAWNSVRAKYQTLGRTPADYKLKFERVAFDSGGTPLAGWYVPSSLAAPRGVIVLCHGVDSTRLALLPKAALLHHAGYAVFLFDFRARGESGGSRCTLGYRETDDLLAAIQTVQSRPDARGLPLGVLGESMGGAVALLGTARSPAVRAVVAEAPYAQLDHAIGNHFRAVLGPPGPLIGTPSRWVGEWLIGENCTRVSPLNEIKKIAPRPVLIIQDGNDSVCPPSETGALLEAAGEPKSLWTVPRADHISALSTAPEEYTHRITAFFDANLH
jgi:fermentation-respiration switch protein FrsA (DUF1100 family)